MPSGPCMFLCPTAKVPDPVPSGPCMFLCPIVKVPDPVPYRPCMFLCPTVKVPDSVPSGPCRFLCPTVKVPDPVPYRPCMFLCPKVKVPDPVPSGPCRLLCPTVKVPDPVPSGPCRFLCPTVKFLTQCHMGRVDYCAHSAQTINAFISNVKFFVWRKHPWGRLFPVSKTSCIENPIFCDFRTYKIYFIRIPEINNTENTLVFASACSFLDRSAEPLTDFFCWNPRGRDFDLTEH